MTTLNWYCPNCEMKMKAELVGIHWMVNCSMCSMGLEVLIVRAMEKTYDQVTLDFDKIPLTDSQRGTKRFSSSKRKIA